MSSQNSQATHAEVQVPDKFNQSKIKRKYWLEGYQDSVEGKESQYEFMDQKKIGYGEYEAYLKGHKAGKEKVEGKKIR